LSFAIVMAGASISKILLVFRHMGLCAHTARSFFRHQRKLIISTRDVILCGDGRFDSMGHSAKYGVYTMQSTSLMKIVHFELVQVSIIIGYSSVKYKIL
jgi:solute carrier family 8 (sodium/calcium exchanger)